MRHEIPVDAKEELLRLLGRHKRLDSNREVLADVSRSAICTVMLDGFAARYKLLSNGRRQITAIHVPGDFVNLHSFLMCVPDHGVTALTHCRVALVEQEALRRLTESSPQLTQILWTDTLIDSAIQREWLVAMGRRTALGRLAHLICELNVRLRIVALVSDNVFKLPLTQSDLADVLGLSVVHVNRILKRLRSDGIMYWNSQTIAILNWDRLCEIAEFDPSYLGLTRLAHNSDMVNA